MRWMVLVLVVGSAAFTARAQWVVQESHTTASLRGIDYVGDGVAWASGTGGTVLRTVDMGKTWVPCAVPAGGEKLDFRGVQAFDAETAIVMSSGTGELSRLYKTVDGCKSWKLVFTNPDKDGFWDGIRFFQKSAFGHETERYGVLVGDPVNDRFCIFVSYDYGTSWDRITKRVVPKAPRSHTHEGLFAASNSAADAVPDAGGLAFVTGGRGGSRYFHLLPGGLVLDYFDSAASFEITNLPFPHSTDAQGAFSTGHRTNGNADFDTMIVGGDYEHPDNPSIAVFLPHATYRWFRRQQPATVSQALPHGYRTAVAYDEALKAWITVGPNGTDVSFDDGRNWRALRPGVGDVADADKDWNALSLPFVVGARGRIGILREEAVAGLGKSEHEGTKDTKVSQRE